MFSLCSVAVTSAVRESVGMVVGSGALRKRGFLSSVCPRWAMSGDR